ncbi:hypothetical protein N1I87_06095 [Bacillus sp. FSL W8-0102]|uniref:hypothetical protein n=1 Tax=Bacillus sp. FSL W8-0102 TaxID=2978205 RepID=UPI0030F51A67
MKNIRRLFLKIFLAVLFIGIGFPIAGLNQVKAEGPLDPAPQIYPTAPNSKKVLFDNTHGQTAGAADWVIDGAFSDFANAIAKEGYFFKNFEKQLPLPMMI